MEQALVYKDKIYTHNDISNLISEWGNKIESISPGSIVMIESSFSPDSIALLFALSQKNCIMVLCGKRNQEIIDISQPEYIISNNEIINCDVYDNEPIE